MSSQSRSNRVEVPEAKAAMDKFKTKVTTCITMLKALYYKGLSKFPEDIYISSINLNFIN